MSFNLMYERPVGDKEKPFAFPMTDINGQIIEEPWDNGLDHRITFRDIVIASKEKNANRFQDVYWRRNTDCDLYITESRLIFQVRSLKKDLKFKGSLIDYGVDALFKKYEDKKVEGKTEVGQLRYEWLSAVMYFEKNGKYDNMLRFFYEDDIETRWQVTLSFKNDLDVRFLANEVLHMACRYREKTKTKKSERTQQFIEKYKTQNIPPAQDTRASFSGVSFPSFMLACYGKDDRPEL